MINMIPPESCGTWNMLLTHRVPPTDLGTWHDLFANLKRNPLTECS